MATRRMQVPSSRIAGTWMTRHSRIRKIPSVAVGTTTSLPKGGVAGVCAGAGERLRQGVGEPDRPADQPQAHVGRDEADDQAGSDVLGGGPGLDGSVASSVPGQASGAEERRSHSQRELAECCRQAERRWDVGGEFVVAASDVLHKRMASGESCGRADLFESAHRAKSGLQPAVVGLNAVVAYCSVTCAAAGTSSSMTRRYGPALSVVTSTGAGPYRRARVKNRRAVAVSRCSDSSTSMTCPYWSTARYR
jgi:hypothetical protein